MLTGDKETRGDLVPMTCLADKGLGPLGRCELPLGGGAGDQRKPGLGDRSLGLLGKCCRATWLSRAQTVILPCGEGGISLWSSE